MVKDMVGAGQYKNPTRKLERMVRGFSNHWRIRILRLLAEQPELSVEEIAKKLGGNFKTIAAHIQKLAATGMVLKRSDDQRVRHALTPRAKSVLKFLRTLE